MPKGYVVFTEHIHDRDALRAYSKAAGPTIAASGAKVLVASDHADILDGTVDIGYVDLQGDNAGYALLGVRVPSEWWTLATVTTGWAAPMSDDYLVLALRGKLSKRPSSHPDATRVRSIAVVTREGDIV